jgi:isopenicillin-N N-acyltransferase-like protein
MPRLLRRQIFIAYFAVVLIADVTGGTGMECSSEDIAKLEMNGDGIVTHTNHFVLKHKESVVEAHDWLPDTWFRLARIGELLNAAKEEEPSEDIAEKILKDETEGDGAAICRSAKKDSIATLFSIVMDLSGKEARLTMGKPTAPSEKLILRP